MRDSCPVLQSSFAQPIMSKSSHEIINRKKKVRCRTFDQGLGCRFGDNCRYLHIISEDPSNTASKVNPGTESIQPSSFDPPNHHDERSVNKEVLPQSRRPPKACHTFSRTGSCKYEDRCRYQHISANFASQSLDSTAQELKKVEQGPTNQEPRRDAAVKLCNVFSKSGHCRFGLSCRFVHIPPDVLGEQHQNQSEGDTLQSLPIPPHDRRRGKGPNRPNGREVTNPRGQPRRNASGKLMKCRFFMAGNCTAAERCKFFHPSLGQLPSKAPLEPEPIDETHDVLYGPGDISDQGSRKTDFTPNVEVSVKPSAALPSLLLIKELTPEEISSLRQTEVKRLQLRYPKREEELRNGETFYKFVFSPTDPDWPYDVKEISLVARFPEAYPTEMMEISVSETEIIPETVREQVELSIKDWALNRFIVLKKNDNAELMFRPFLKWLDRNIERIFTEGLKQYQREIMAKAAGIEFIPAKKLQEEDAKHQSDEEEDKAESDREDTELQKENIPEEDKDIEQEREGQEAEQQKTEMDPARRGTEVKLQNFQLTENAATLLATQVMVIVQCYRCRNKTEFKSPAERTNSVACSKCSETQLVTFRASMAHQFSSVIGYLDLLNCTVFDLVLSESSFDMGCLGCNKEMKLQGLLPGQMKDTWCHNCHGKMRIGADNARFLALQPAQNAVSGSLVTVDIKKVKKVPKDPAIKEGSSLPNDGTCKHYKKSFRWLRFPCCGKAYPCDICHDDNEGDHEMKYANRMICGFCCKEQVYSGDKPCITCGSSLTKKSSSHWEGGKGCRDKITMSKDDDKKYANINKTISRKSQRIGAPAGQKTTKLRHI